MSGILLVPLGAGTPPPALHFKRAAFSYGVRGACGTLRPPSGQQNGPSGGLQAGAAIPSRTIIGGKASGVGQVPEEPEVPSMALKNGPGVPWRTGRSLSSRKGVVRLQGRTVQDRQG